jgi:hypothetical protein
VPSKLVKTEILIPLVIWVTIFNLKIKTIETKIQKNKIGST